jgi:hypothetical protein
MNQPEKLLQLRAKTDRQLLRILNSKVELAERSLQHRERALQEVEELLGVMNEQQRSELLRRVNRLRESTRVLTASSY